MKRTAVQSTAIKSIGYSPRSLILEIEFVSGQVVRYFGPGVADHKALMEAESIGRHFRANIRDRYAHRTIKCGQRKPKQDSVLNDLSAIADYLRQENGGELPMASELLAA